MRRGAKTKQKTDHFSFFIDVVNTFQLCQECHLYCFLHLLCVEQLDPCYCYRYRVTENNDAETHYLDLNLPRDRKNCFILIPPWDQ